MAATTSAAEMVVTIEDPFVVDDGTPAIAEDEKRREVTTMTTKGDGNYLRGGMMMGLNPQGRGVGLSSLRVLHYHNHL